MKTFSLVGIFAVGTMTNLSPPAATVDDIWFELDGSASPVAFGGSINHEEEPYSTPMALAARLDGTMVAAWTQLVTVTNPGFIAGEIYVREWDGSEWVDLGDGSSAGRGISVSAFYSVAPSIAFDADGHPVIAWIDRYVREEIYGVIVSRWSGQEWERLGEPVAVSPTYKELIERVSLAANASGELFVAWDEEIGGSYDVYVRRWDGGSWVEVGAGSGSGTGVSDTYDVSESPSLAIDSEGRPTLAWIEAAPSQPNRRVIYVRRFDGNSWVPVTPNSASGDLGIVPPTLSDVSFSDPQLIGLSDGRLAVSAFGSGSGRVLLQSGDDWLSAGAPFDDVRGHIAVDANATLTAFLPRQSTPDFRRWDGTDWVSAFPNVPPDEPPIAEHLGFVPEASALGPNGLPRVLGRRAPGDSLVSVHLVGEQWEPLDAASAGRAGIVTTVGRIMQITMDLREQDIPVIAWTDSATSSVSMATWTGSDWESLGPGDNLSVLTFGGRGPMAMAVNRAGNPGVVWSMNPNSLLRFLQWNGESWLNFSLGIDLPADSPVLAYDAFDRPIVAYSRALSVGRREIHVRRQIGGVWQSLPSNASLGGASNSGNVAVTPSLAVDISGVPTVAWANTGNGPSQIYVRRFDGIDWRELGINSATGSGVSSTETESLAPSLAVAANGDTMIAWEELTSPRQIYVRRWDGSAWLEVGDGSASGGGISNTDGDSVSPRLSMDYNGVPTVIWNERTPIPERNERKIHVRRFDGTSWVEVGEGSAAGDGISGEGVTSALPLVATSPHGALHAAWIQQNAAIFYKRTVPVPPPATGGIIVSDNFPLFATPGSARTVEVRALNSGQSTWDISIPVTLQSPAGSDPLFPQDAFVLTRQPGEIFNVPIKTGEVGLFTALLVVPDHHRPATDTTHWRLHDPNLGFFGAEISREIHIVALPLEGSANGDALVDAADIVALTNHLNGGTQILDIQCFANADVTNDGMLDQLDLDSLVNLVLGR